ncbi:MAG: methyltransferase [Promethearchaeota archaeon]
MKPLPTTSFSYDKNILSKLGETLKEYHSSNIDVSQENYLLSTELLDLLDGEILHFLLLNGLVQSENDMDRWNFQYVFSDNLLLFCDLPSFERHRQYVWLSSNVSGGSWAFSRSLPVKKGMKVLDLGTGSGLLALMARLKGGTALGVDVNPRAVQLAQLNRDLNGLNSVDFQIRNWNSVESDRFDLIVSQPPFGISSGEISLGYSFNGGDLTGLQATKEIVKRFYPQENQTLGLFVHVLENDSHSRFLHLLKKWIIDESISIDLQPQYNYSIKIWWERLLKKQRLKSSLPISSDLQSYNEVVAYIAYLTR